MTELERMREVCVKAEEVYNGKLLKITKETVKIPSGELAERDVVGHIGAVCIVPIDDDGNVICERQFRYPINQVVLEIPAGKLDSGNEDHLEAAKRELREETGYSASEWTYLGHFYPAPAYSRETIYMYMAKGLTLGERDLDFDENIDVIKIPLEELVKMIDNGEVPDLKTQASVLRANLRK